MSSIALQHVAILSSVTSLAALFVAVARVPLRGTLGARAAYWLWLAVPASAAALALPRLAAPSGTFTTIAPDVFGWAWARLDGLIAAIHVSGALGTAGCVAWATGAGAALALMGLRQRSFARSLGSLVALPDGTWRSRRVTEPMLIGALRPKVLVPLDFEARYSAEERELVLAHERTHMRRGDTLVNAFGAAWLCVFWFNPLMYWAMRLLRFDQDLACDAAVLAAAGKGRRGRYAEALLKAQLAGEGALPLPLACHWRSTQSAAQTDRGAQKSGGRPDAARDRDRLCHLAGGIGQPGRPCPTAGPGVCADCLARRDERGGRYSRPCSRRPCSRQSLSSYIASRPRARAGTSETLSQVIPA